MNHGTTHERFIERLKFIESQEIDVTFNYERWYKIGFAIATEYGEEGREYFHRVSQFYPRYKYRECDSAYTYYVRNTRGLITIKTFFFLTKWILQKQNLVSRY